MKINLAHLVFFLFPFSGHAQWQLVNPLSESKFYVSATAAQGKAFFAGGSKGNFPTKKLEIYDFGTGATTTRNLSAARAGIAVVEYGGKVYCAGGFTFTPASFSNVDVYDIAADTFGLMQLSVPRYLAAAVEAGGKIMIAGGVTLGPNNAQLGSDVVDIYDPATNSWYQHHLSQARGAAGVARIGNKIIFAGGLQNINTASNRVDLYDAGTGEWSIDSLSQARGYPAVVAAGKYVLVAGGNSELLGAWDVVDIWDSETGAWTVATLSEPRTLIAGAVAGNKAYFIGGGFADNSTHSLTGSSARVDIFDAETGEWSANDLRQNRIGHAAAAWGSAVITGGGLRPEQGGLTATVEIFVDSSIVSSQEPGANRNDLFITPNPVADFLQVNNAALDGQPFEIFDIYGRRMATYEAVSGQAVSVSGLAEGIYTIHARSVKGQLFRGRFLKIN